MTRLFRVRPAAVVLAVTAAAVALFAPAPKPVAAAPDPLPAELRMIPGDAAFFVHVDLAALYDSKLGDAIKNTKSAELKEKLGEITKELGLTVADVKTVAFVIPDAKELQGLQKGFTVVTTRKEYDRAKLIAKMKADAAKAKDEFSEKDGVVRVKSARFANRVQVTDLRDPKRMVILNDVPETHLKVPADAPTGLHADAIRRAAKEPLVAGVNFNAMPDEIRAENLPAEVRPFRPFLLADSLTAVGTLTKDAIDLTVKVKSKDAANAADVEKAFGAVQAFVALGIPQAKRGFEKEAANPKEFVPLLDAAAKAVAGAKITLEDKDATAKLSLPIDVPVGSLLEFMAGGGASAIAVSQNNLKQLALAVYNYESTYGHYPPAVTLGKKGKKLLSWRVAILPYIEQEALYKKFNQDEPWDSEHNKKVFEENPMPKVFAVPGTKNLDDKKTHYQVFVGNGAMFETVAALKPTDITDGTSNTVMVATAAAAVEWTKPDDIEFDPKAEMKKLLLFKNGVCSMTFGDGSVRAVTEKLAEGTLKAIITRSGGEVVSDF